MARRPRAQGRKQQSNLVAPLAVFVMLFIICFGAAIYFLVEWRDLNARIWGGYKRQTDAKYEEPERTEEGYRGYLLLLTELDEKCFVYADENKKLIDTIGMSELDALQDRFNELKKSVKAIDAQEGEATTFVEFMRRVVLAKQNLEQRIADADKAKDDINRQLAETQRDLAALEKQYGQSVTAADEKYKQNDRDLNEKLLARELDITKRERQIVDLKQEKEELREKSVVDLRKAKQELSQARQALKEVQLAKSGTREKEFTLDHAESDGIILNVDDLGRFCSVDIGLKDGAQVGMQFIVCETEPGGKRREKATIELNDVKPDFSTAGFVETRDKLDPVMKDDDIISPLFKRGQPRVFVFEDDIELMERKSLAVRIERFGNKVSDTVTPKTDFVVIKDNPGKMADEATKWAVRRIRLKDIKKILGN
ncbi:MAG: hypothetical protein HQ592_01350 [Planctomycetes bacterium]|nr:hypothetical protein [Planctomycetota bacterium]